MQRSGGSVEERKGSDVTSNQCSLLFTVHLGALLSWTPSALEHFWLWKIADSLGSTPTELNNGPLYFLYIL